MRSPKNVNDSTVGSGSVTAVHLNLDNSGLKLDPRPKWLLAGMLLQRGRSVKTDIAMGRIRKGDGELQASFGQRGVFWRFLWELFGGEMRA